MTHGKRNKQKSHLCQMQRAQAEGCLPNGPCSTVEGVRWAERPSYPHRAWRSSRSRQATLKLDSCRRIVPICNPSRHPFSRSPGLPNPCPKSTSHTTGVPGFCDAPPMGHLLGYTPVSTTDQQPQLQVDALQHAGCYRVFTKTASGARTERPTLEQVLDQRRPGDTLVVWKPDRLGRSLRHLVDTSTLLGERGVGFRSLQEARAFAGRGSFAAGGGDGTCRQPTTAMTRATAAGRSNRPTEASARTQKATKPPSPPPARRGGDCRSPGLEPCQLGAVSNPASQPPASVKV
jgi:Resolvase, N terminal domain